MYTIHTLHEEADQIHTVKHYKIMISKLITRSTQYRKINFESFWTCADHTHTHKMASLLFVLIFEKKKMYTYIHTYNNNVCCVVVTR